MFISAGQGAKYLDGTPVPEEETAKRTKGHILTVKQKAGKKATGDFYGAGLKLSEDGQLSPHYFSRSLNMFQREGFGVLPIKYRELMNELVERQNISKGIDLRAPDLNVSQKNNCFKQAIQAIQWTSKINHIPNLS